MVKNCCLYFTTFLEIHVQKCLQFWFFTPKISKMHHICNNKNTDLIQISNPDVVWYLSAS